MEERMSVEIPVIYTTDRGLREKTVSLVAGGQAISVARGPGKEEILRRAIDQLDGLQRDVMSDMYRQLVWGNFLYMDGKRGKKALPDLDREYPDRGTLPGFRRRSTDNAPGMIVYNLLLQGDEPAAGYRVLANILVAMLKAGVWDRPKLGTELPEMA